MRRFLAAVVIAILTVPSAGCLVRRDIVALQDHPSGTQTLMTTQDTHFWFFSYSLTHQQWTCSPQQDGMMCIPQCGKGMPEQCARYGLFIGNQ